MTFCVCVEGGIGDFVCVWGGGGHFVSDKVGCVYMCMCIYVYCTVREGDFTVFFFTHWSIMCVSATTSLPQGKKGFNFSFPVYNPHNHTTEIRGFPFSGEHNGWVGNNQHPGWLRHRGWEHHCRQGQRQHCWHQPGHLLGRATGILGKEGELEGWTLVITFISETIDEEPSLRLKEGTTY